MKDYRDPEKHRGIIVDDIMGILGHGPGSLSIDPLPQDASMRRYYRVTGSQLKIEATGDDSIIMMVLADPNPRAPSEEISGNGVESDEETRFPEPEDLDFVNVLRHYEKCGAPVPKLYAYNVPLGFLYIEDLGDNLLESVQAEMDGDTLLDTYLGLVEIIAGLHEKATALKNPGFVGFKRGFDEKLLLRELMHYVEYGIEARKEMKLDRADMETVTHHMKLISAELAAEPHVVSHRDFQSRNILIKNGKPRIIDFQDALMGVRQYDLVALLRDSYVKLPWEVIDACIDRYCEIIERENGESIDRERFNRVFHLQTLQRKIKDAGRFDFIDIVKGNPNFLKYIPNTLTSVREAFDRLPEHEPMREALGRYTPELLGE